MHVRANGLRVVDGVAGLVERGAIREVANVIDEDGRRQGRSGGVAVGANVLRMVDGIAGPVHGSAVGKVADVVAELQVAEGISLEPIQEVSGSPELHTICWGGTGKAGGNRRGGGHGSWCSRRCSTTLHGEVACYRHISAIHKVADVRRVLGRRKRRAGCVQVRANGLRVVDGVAGLVERGAIREVTHRVHEVGTWQRRARRMPVRANVLRVVDNVACPVHRSAVGQVAGVVAELQVSKNIRVPPVRGDCTGNLWSALCGVAAHEGRGRRLLGPVKAGCLHRGLASVAELLLPSRVDLVGVLLEGQEGTLDLLVGLCELDDAVAQADVAVLACLPSLPSLFTLTARNGTRLGAILVSKGAATSGQDHIGMAQVLEEGRQAERIHAAGDNGSRLLHALPLLVIVGAIGLIVLQHEGNVLVGSISLHLAKAHGACVDAGGSDDTRNLGVDKGSVAALGLGARHRAVAGSVVVQELLGEVAAGAGHGGASCDVSIHQEGAVLGQRSELGHAVLAAGDHLVRIIRGDVGREQLANAGLLDAGPHGLHDLRDDLVHLTEHLVALRLILSCMEALPQPICLLPLSGLCHANIKV